MSNMTDTLEIVDLKDSDITVRVTVDHGDKYIYIYDCLTSSMLSENEAKQLAEILWSHTK